MFGLSGVRVVVYSGKGYSSYWMFGLSRVRVIVCKGYRIFELLDVRVIESSSYSI